MTPMSTLWQEPTSTSCGAVKPPPAQGPAWRLLQQPCCCQQLCREILLLPAAGKQWAVVMSRCNEFREQVVELDYMYSSEGIHRRWDEGGQGMQFVSKCCEGRDRWHFFCGLRSSVKGALS